MSYQVARDEFWNIMQNPKQPFAHNDFKKLFYAKIPKLDAIARLALS